MLLSPDQQPETLGDLIATATTPPPTPTQASLAAAAGLSRWHLAKLVNGYNANLTPEQLTRLAQGLGVSLKRASRALEASKQAVSSRRVSHKSRKGLAARGMGKKP